MGKRKRIYRRAIQGMIVFNLILICLLTYHEYKKSMPDSISVVQGKKSYFNFHIPAKAQIYKIKNDVNKEEKSIETMGRNVSTVSLKKSFCIHSDQTGNYIMKVKLFGMIDLKTVNLNVKKERKVCAGGEPVGIYVETNGVMVIGTGVVESINNTFCEPAKNLVLSGDYITKAGNIKIGNKAQLIKAVKNSEGKKMILTINRKGEEIKIKVVPCLSKDGYKIGIWVRDDSQGVGTLTYTDGNRFGGLGHGIRDMDTGELIEINKGSVYKTKICSIVKGRSGKPGELVGMIDYAPEDYLGKINKNTGYGIFGNLENQSEINLEEKKFPVACKQEVKEGDAFIQSYVEGEKKMYRVRIEQVDISDRNIAKSMIIRITDKELLQKTGGIVQGMSGTPIIQNGKIVGAITHVFVQDSTKGYGTFIENMINASE